MQQTLQKILTVEKFYQIVREIYNNHAFDWSDNPDGYNYIGLRFEDKQREIGEICEYSRHNADREDERDFPKYGTPEYWDMEELNGTSAWNMEPYGKKYHPGAEEIYSWEWEQDATKIFQSYHCYVIAGNNLGRHDDPDPNEIVIQDAVVIAQLF